MKHIVGPLLIALSLVACTTTQPSDSTPPPATATATAGARAAIPFNEPDDFTISDELRKAMAFNSIHVVGGDYEIRFDEQHPFGVALLDLEFTFPAAGAPGQREHSIRIGRRDRNCSGGISFRCALTNEPADPAARLYRVNITTDNLTQLRIVFLEQVDWAALNP